MPVSQLSALLQFRVAALINDSVGTLAGGCYVDADTKIGVILGTGTNACYVEEASNISALAGKNGHGQQRPLMAINTEWGNFDASSLPSTDVRPRIPALSRLSFSTGEPRLTEQLFYAHHGGLRSSLTHGGWGLSLFKLLPNLEVYIKAETQQGEVRWTPMQPYCIQLLGRLVSGLWLLLTNMSCLQIDRDLDADTPNAGNHHFEKMVSGMYLGEVARRAILKLAVRAFLWIIVACCVSSLFQPILPVPCVLPGLSPRKPYLTSLKAVAARSCLQPYYILRHCSQVLARPLLLHGRIPYRRPIQDSTGPTNFINFPNKCAGRGRAVWAGGSPAAAGTLGANDASACQNRRGRQLAPVRHSAGAVRDTGPASLALHPHRLPPGVYAVFALALLPHSCDQCLSAPGNGSLFWPAP